MAECGKVSSKTCLGLLGLLFWAAAAILIAFGAYVFATFDVQNLSQFAESTWVLIPAAVIIAVGVLFLIAGLIGCCNVCRESKCLLYSFGIILFLLVALLVTAVVMTFVWKGKLISAINTNGVNLYENYDGNSSASDDLDYFQEKVHCCGYKSVDIYKNSTWGREPQHRGRVPESCCKDMVNVTDTLDDDGCAMSDNGTHWDKTCYGFIESNFITKMYYISGAAMVFVILLVVGFVATCALICRKTEDDAPYYSLNH